MEWTNTIRSDRISEGKSTMVNIGRNVLMILKLDGEIHATEGLCKHMKWPLSWGGKLEDGCVTCPLHQTSTRFAMVNCKNGLHSHYSHHTASWLAPSSKRRILGFSKPELRMVSFRY